MLEAAERRQPRPGRRPWGRSALVTSLFAALGLALLVGPVSATPAGSVGSTTKSYSNPLAPAIPAESTVDSCADPTVIKGQDGESRYGQQIWYLYCTTDPLNDTDVDEDGNPVFHRIPTMSSTDLVNWTYIADAFPLNGGDMPAWIDPSAAFWAPDVVSSSATDQYYLLVTVTETTAAGGGSDTCRGDSAIGVAVGSSPTGPWDFADDPVVRPRLDPYGGPCSYFWTFDPDILGDTVGDEGTLYYGSYYGGLLATDVTFTETGVTAATADPATTPASRSGIAMRAPMLSAETATTTCSRPPPTAATAP